MEEHQINKGYIVCLEETLRKIIWEMHEIYVLPL